MEFFEFTIRLPKPSRRFSLRTLLLAVAVVAVGLYVYVSTARYDVTAIVVVSDRSRALTSPGYDYRTVKASILQLLRSDMVIRSAVESATGREVPVDQIRARLVIRFLDESEYLEISFRGREFRDDKKAITAIVNAIARQCVESFSDGTTQAKLLQPAVVR